jgi:hypothetical protein
MAGHVIQHLIRDKIPIFTAEQLDANSRYPVMGSMQCEVVQYSRDGQGRDLARIRTIESIDGVTQFTVDANLVTTVHGEVL